MSSRWYYEMRGQRVGPVSFRELVRMVHCGQLAEEDLVRAEYMPNWQRADTVVGLFYLARRHSAAIPWVDDCEHAQSDHVPSVSDVVNTAPPGVSLAAENGPATCPLEAKTESQPCESLAATMQDAVADLDARAVNRRIGATRPNWFRRRTLPFRPSLWSGLARIGAAALGAGLAGGWMRDWSAREALRFPGVFGENARVFPLWGQCRPVEYWVFVVDLMFVAGVMTYLAMRWVENNVDQT